MLVIRSTAVTAHGVQQRVDATAELNELTDSVVDALRTVYGNDTVIHRLTA